MKSYKCFKKGSPNEDIKILLVYPRTGSDAEGFSLHVPLSLLYLATQLQDYSVAIYDQRVDSPSVLAELLDKRPLCAGISTMTGRQIEYAIEIAKEVKERKITTVFGGAHPTLLPEQTKENIYVDYVISGEGEYAFRHLVNSLQKEKSAITPVIYGSPVNLDDLNLLDVYDLVDIEHYTHNHVMEGRCLPFQFSRGCPFWCTFCCNSVLSKSRWRQQSFSVAIPILKKMMHRYGLDSIWFVDENLTSDPKSIIQLATEIGAEFNWYIQARSNSLLKIDVDYLDRMGLKGIGSGLESGSSRVLIDIKKKETVEEYIESNRKMSKTNIKMWYNYMMGYPQETIEDIKHTINLSLQMMSENPNAYNNTFYLLTPYPGTEIGSLYKKYMPLTFSDWSKFGRHNVEAAWHDSDMRKLYDRIIFSSKFVGRKLIRVHMSNESLKKLTEDLTKKWIDFDFFDDSDWALLYSQGVTILKNLFGDNAY
jgi:radical SAM superfamily enzyme YgiQ (UPF0313 family)